MKAWILFIAFFISFILTNKYFWFDQNDSAAYFWLGFSMLSLGIWWGYISTDEFGKNHNSDSPMFNIIYWIITISFLATGITGYLFGEDSLATRIAAAPIILIIGVPLIFLLIGGLLSGLLGGLSNSNSTKNTTYSVKGTFDGKNFEAKAKKDK
tara:strand:+ start:419 stop:880 length:462 start_codon:yes stop_codon:yes gene_type:complete